MDNKDKQKQYKRKWYYENREKAIAYSKKWQKENKERVNEKNRNYRKENAMKLAKIARDWRTKNPDKVREYKRKWGKRFRERRKEFLHELRVNKGGKCSECGYHEYVDILHFHHIADKSFSIGSYRRYSNEALLKEAEKCILLCPNCHSIKHLITEKNVLD